MRAPSTEEARVPEQPDTANCVGRGTLDGDHCCYIEGVECPFLERGTVPGMTFVCGLRRRLGSWDAVHADPEYQAIVQSVWDRVGVASCGAWQPNPGECCREGER
jgi:hypothetical protein